MLKISTFLLCLSLALNGFAQSDSLRLQYYQQQRAISRRFSGFFYPQLNQIYSFKEKKFVQTIDSLRSGFQTALNNYKAKNKGDADFIRDEQRGIDYFFDKFILDYPYFHQINTGDKTVLSPAAQKRLARHLSDFNTPSLLSNSDFKEYVRGFLRHRSSEEMKKPFYKKMDNQRLNSTLAVIPNYFKNDTCREFWLYDYLYNHLDEWGCKNLGNVIKNFKSSVHNAAYLRTIDSFYTESVNSLRDHLVLTYKTVDGFDLDMHLFLPDSSYKGNRPVIAFFSGGSWTKGNSEWAFSSCADYAKKGWVAASVEYRLADRQNTSPFEAVMDARSAVRWLHKNAGQYHIDTDRIVVSGNSAGGHLVLSAAMADNCNEKTDDLHFSAVPNLVLVNSGVYDLVGDGHTGWISQSAKEQNNVREISPIHLIKEGLPPVLVIHGTNDRSVAYETAAAFANAMKKTKNDFEFDTIEGAPHYIWYDRRYSGQVYEWRAAFLKRHGY
jgi:acetyl esterase/lipase